MVARGYGIMVFMHTLKEVNLGCKGLWDYGIYTTFNNISVILYRSVLLVEETGVSGENKCCIEYISNSQISGDVN